MQLANIAFAAVATSFANASLAQFSTVIDVPYGSIRHDSFVSDTQVNVFVGGRLQRSNGSPSDTVTLGGSSGINVELNMLGGTAESVRTDSQTTVNMSSGEISRLVASGEVNISGGTIQELWAWSEAEVNISGGIVDDLLAVPGSVVNIVAEEFLLDGRPFNILPGDTRLYTDRDELLSGSFASGEQFSFDLKGNFHISADATLTLTRVVPEPTTETLALFWIFALSRVGACQRRDGFRSVGRGRC